MTPDELNCIIDQSARNSEAATNLARLIADLPKNIDDLESILQQIFGNLLQIKASSDMIGTLAELCQEEYQFFPKLSRN